MYKSFFNLNILKNWVPACAGMTILFLIPVAFAQGLFQESYNSMNTDEQLETYSDPLVIRNRQAVMDSSQLFQSVSNNKSLTLNLFADVELKAQIKNSRSLLSGASFMSGSLENGGHITLFISKEGIVRGEVHSTQGIYTIKSSKKNNGNNNIIIRQIDTSNLPPIDDGAISVRPDFHSDRLDSPEKSSGDFSVYKNFQNTESSLEEETPDEIMDVLVVYTPGAETNEGGKAEVEATIEAEIEKMNQALVNSGLSHRKVRLVGMEKVEYTQSSRMINDLWILREEKGTNRDPNGLLDEVHELREQYGADLVHLFVRRDPAGFCGRAFLHSLDHKNYVEDFCKDNSNPDECIDQKRRELWRKDTYSVSAINRTCTITNAFAHEIGHTLGLEHDRYWQIKYNLLTLAEPIKLPIKPYGFGYTNQNFNRTSCNYTIMAIWDQCIDEGFRFIPRDLMFSNPDLNFSSWDDPAGVAGERWSEDADGPANASRAIDEVWDIVANLYKSTIPIVTPTASCNDVLFSNIIPDTIGISAAGGTKKYTISGNVDGCPNENLNLTVESSSSFITTSVETRTVTNDDGDESFEYDVTLTVSANNSCNARTGNVSFSGDDSVSKDISINQSSSKLCGLISDTSSDMTLENIVSLDFSGESINYIGGFLFTNLTDLESLNLSNNSIRILPANVFTRATNLEDLDDDNLNKRDQIHLISNNMSITGLVNVKKLDLSNNLISRLHALTFSNLFNLEKLNLSNNSITGLPANVFSDLVELEELDLSNNQIKALPATTFVGTGNLKELDLSNNQIRSLSATVFNNLTELEELDLSGNQIGTLSIDVFSNTTKLKYLWLHDNNMPRILNAFSTLTNLKALSLDGNAVRALSANAFSKTTELEYLWLSADEITKLSGNLFAKPVKLKYLNLSVNKLTELPAILFSKLTNLRYLSLSVNGVTTLPDSVFTRLTNLRYLRLSGESITSLPAQVCTFINNVKYVRVSGFDLETVCPSSAAGVSVTNFFQRVVGVVSDSIGNNNTSTGVSNANTGFASYNENVITKLYEDNITPSEISRLTGYDEDIVSQTIQSQPLLQ